MPDRPIPTPDGASAEPAAAATGADTSSSSTTFQLSQEPFTAANAPAPSPAVPAPAYEHLGELPTSYGGPSVYLVAYDPRRLFAYWDLEPATLRAGAALALRVRRADTGETESQAPVEAGAAGSHSGQYLPVQRAGASYFVELGHGGGSGMPWRALAVSARVTAPPEGLAAADGDAQFATLPFHLSFQRLTDLLRGVMQGPGGPGLTEALGQVQQNGGNSGDAPPRSAADSAMLDALGRLNPEQQRNLQTVLALEMQLSSGGPAGSDQQISSSSAAAPTSGASSSQDVFRRGAGPSPSSGDLSSGAFSSRGFAAGKAGGSEGLSSRAFAPGAGRYHLSSAAFVQTSPGGGPSSGASSHRPGAGGGSEGMSSRPAAGAGKGLGSSDFLLRGGPSSEAWRRPSGGAPAGGGGGSDVFARERADRFLRAVTSSLDVLGALFSASGAGGSGPSSSSPTSSSPGRW